MPDVYQAFALARINGRIEGQMCINTLHLAWKGALPIDPNPWPALLLQLAGAMLECAFESLLPAVTSDYQLLNCDAQLLHPVKIEPQVAVQDPQTGFGALSEVTVPFLTTVVNKRTGQGGRNGRGKWFLPPVGENESGNGQIVGGTLNNVTAFLECVAGKFLIGTGTENWVMGVLSQKNLKAVGGTYDNSFRPIISLAPNAFIGKLTSRQIGHGS